MKWSDKIPEGGKKRKPAPSQQRYEREERSGPGFLGFLWSIIKLILWGGLALVILFWFLMFNESNLASLFMPILVFIGVWIVPLLLLGLLLKAIVWVVSLPFRRR